MGTREYKIIVREKNEDKGLIGNYGYSDSYKEIIVLRSGLTAGHLRTTLLHEIFHAINFTFGTGFASVPPRGKKEDYSEYRLRWEHYYIERYEEALLLVLRANPDLIEFLLMD